MNLLLLKIIVLITIVPFILSENKYSESKNVNNADLRFQESAFRSQKVNMFWSKARKRLTDEQLNELFGDLKIQDKEEMYLKKIKAEGQDKDGTKEAEIRRKLLGIMHRFDLIGHFEEDAMVKTGEHKWNDAVDKEALTKQVFSDKKLNKLWLKAEKSGFSAEELKTLKEEFQHHQDKIDEYYEIMDKAAVANDNDNFDNSVHGFLNKEDVDTSKEKLKEKHRELKSNYEKLGKLAVTGPEKMFEESRVAELWKLAKKAAFSDEELDSLKEELLHYERRVRKLKFLQDEVDNVESHANSLGKSSDDLRKRSEQRLKEYSHKMNKVHGDFESRIMQRHLEL